MIVTFHKHRLSSPVLAACAIAAVIAVIYGRTLGYGLFWDDYAALRPRPWPAIAGAWTGEWDPGGVWPAFYRPLALWMYAGLGATIGGSAWLMHLLTLGGLFAVAWRLRAVVHGETGDASLGLVAAVLLVVHPETPSSMAAWLSQLFHLMPLIAVLSAIRAWQRGLGRPRAWVATLLWLTAGLLFKEDVLVMAPALLAWQMFSGRQALVEARRPPSAALMVAVVGWMVAYLAWRQAMLGEIGGYVRPEWWLAARNVFSVPLFTVALQWIPGAHAVSVASGIGVAALAGSAWRARASATPALRSLALGGALIVAAAAAPLVLIAGHTRVHMAVVGAVLLFTAAIGIVRGEHTAGRPAGRWRRAAFAVGVCGMLAANWQNTSTFAPCSPFWLRTSADVVEWDIVAPAVRAALARTIAACPGQP